MFENRKSRLTGSREKRSPKAKPALLDMLDALDDHCNNLAALAGWMEACGHHPQGEPLNRRLVADTGTLIVREVRQVRARLDRLAKAAR